MKFALFVFLVSLVAPARAVEASPIAKVLEMLSELQAKIIKEGEVAHKEYAGYTEWCEDKSKDLHYEIKTGEGEVAELKATIEKEAATIEELTAKIEELGSKSATAEKELKEATGIREKEAKDFAAEEKDLKEVLSALTRAIGILSEEAAGAALLQYKGASNLVQALSALVQASVLNAADGQKLTALVQQQSSESDEDEGAGEPAAAVYEGHSGGIVETLEGLQSKAEEQLAAARKAETTAQYNFDMLKQSLEDEIKVASGELDEAKNNMAVSKENKGIAEGDLDVTSKDLAEDVKALAETHTLCMTTAEDFEAAVKGRSEELEALAAAKKVLKEKTGGADELEYGLNQVSFLQVESKGRHYAVVRFIMEMARKRNSKSLAQLAHRVSATIRLGSTRGRDPFAKVKGLISDMIARLESEGEADASHKAYCDKETKETTAKKDEKTAEVEKMSTAIDEMTSRIAVLEEEVATLMGELATISKSQAGYDTWFKELEETFQANKKDMEAGIEGVQLALKVLRDYYAKGDGAGGAGTSIIGLLEVVESDFTKSLAEMQANYDSQKLAYEQTTKENEVTVAAKNQDLKYKEQEITTLKKSLKETTEDRSGVQTELDAVLEYFAKIEEQCVEKAEPYEETKKRREEEIAGLKEALSILEGEAVLLQEGRSSTRRVGRAGSRAQLRGGASVL